MAESLLSNKNLREFIEKLKIKEEQKSVLLNDLPQMNEKERLELLKTLEEVYLLNQEEDQAIKKIEQNWK